MTTTPIPTTRARLALFATLVACLCLFLLGCKECWKTLRESDHFTKDIHGCEVDGRLFLASTNTFILEKDGKVIKEEQFSASKIQCVEKDYAIAVSLIEGIMVYDENEWSAFEFSNTENTENIRWRSVWGNSRNNVFFSGEQGRDITSADLGAGVLFHYDGKTMDEVFRVDDQAFFRVWGLDNDNVFVFGVNALYRGGLSGFVKMDLGVNVSLKDIWGTAEDDLYLLADRRFSNGDRGETLILHFDGQSWQRVENKNAKYTWTIFGTEEEVYFAGENRVILKRGDKWKDLSDGLPNEEGLYLYDGWAHEEYGLFVVGTRMSNSEPHEVDVLLKYTCD